MKTSERIERGGQGLGWWVILGSLTVALLSSSVWALDLDQALRENEAENAQISSTLGGQHLASATSKTSGSGLMGFKLIKKVRRHKPK